MTPRILDRPPEPRLATAYVREDLEGEPRPVWDVADEAIEDALRVDGLAATLRFR